MFLHVSLFLSVFVPSLLCLLDLCLRLRFVEWFVRWLPYRRLPRSLLNANGHADLHRVALSFGKGGWQRRSDSLTSWKWAGVARELVEQDRGVREFH